MRKKGIPEVLARSVMCLHEGAMVRVDSVLSEVFEAKMGMHRGYVLSPSFCSGGSCSHRIC